MKPNFLATLAAVSVICVTFRVAVSAEEQYQTKRSADFDRIKAMAGEWSVSGGDEHTPKDGTISYKVTAGGSAVLETLFGGTDHEMVTMYYVDGDDLKLTHYCMLHNRPMMKAEKNAGNGEKLVFKCDEADNKGIEGEMHMHEAAYTFVDPDHVKTEWTLHTPGKPDSKHQFELTRKK